MSHSFRLWLTVLTSISLAGAASAQSDGGGHLQLEAKIPLGQVRGRIDHMAVDLKRQRLFVAELGNDAVGVVDLANRSVVRTLSGLHEPQGVGYEPSTDALYVANAGDGSLRVFDGNTYALRRQIELGSDADNIRVDAGAQRVIVGHGGGSLAYLDPATLNTVQSASLKAHPESFQIDPNSGRIFVNVPNSRAVAVLDGASGKLLSTWPMEKGGNFAMAIDLNRNRLLLAFRNPPALVVLELADGRAISTVDTCDDVDDLFVDSRRKRTYVSCGQGYVDVFETQGTTYQRISRVPTAAGARTSLFVPELDRLMVAVREGPAGPAAIWIFKPVP
ncbi:YncE family protein [Bradyrhizobium sp. SRS-191]|uniref:YncE family protein n=1 Tax=Bradyrhizobium sp. SRS-191 TaxID=2962606 RepID=UPI00211DCBD9|nr:YncE family protein [Bradyrhizobium sp. SRS-191]